MKLYLEPIRDTVVLLLCLYALYWLLELGCVGYYGMNACGV